MRHSGDEQNLICPCQTYVVVEFIFNEALILRRNVPYEQGLDSAFVKKTEGSMRGGAEFAEELLS